MCYLAGSLPLHRDFANLIMLVKSPHSCYRPWTACISASLCLLDRRSDKRSCSSHTDNTVQQSNHGSACSDFTPLVWTVARGLMTATNIPRAFASKAKAVMAPVTCPPRRDMSCSNVRDSRVAAVCLLLHQWHSTDRSSVSTLQRKSPYAQCENCL